MMGVTSEDDFVALFSSKIDADLFQMRMLWQEDIDLPHYVADAKSSSRTPGPEYWLWMASHLSISANLR